MRHTHKNYLSGTAIAIALALPTTALAGGKMAPMEPVVVTPAPAAPMSQPMTWTGFYGGLGLGYARGASGTDITGVEPEGDFGPLQIDPSFSPRVSGFFGSGRLGYDVQSGNFVFGGLIEGTLGKISGSESFTFGEGDTAPGETFHGNASYSNLMSVAVRGGGLVNDGNTLVYGRLGMSRAKLSADVSGAEGVLASGSSTGTGVNVGLGAEHLLTESISVFAEYNYHDVGTSFSISADEEAPSWDVNGKALHALTMGVNFRF